jgi:hypothetical protein
MLTIWTGKRAESNIKDLTLRGSDPKRFLRGSDVWVEFEQDGKKVDLPL